MFVIQMANSKGNRKLKTADQLKFDLDTALTP